MREWQVGDPVGDGNDIGVPDIPYMGYLREDEEEEQEEELTLDEFLDRLLSKIYGSPDEKVRIKAKIYEFMLGGFNLVKVNRQGVMRTDFIFECENEYFKATLIAIFLPGTRISGRVFEDYELENDFSKLLQNESFKSAVLKLEMKKNIVFDECGGGYDLKLRYDGSDDMELDENHQVIAYFKDNGETVRYFVDLDNMELEKWF